ncbi:MAG: hypothetical protein LBQ47_02525, partial [Endomicrobium sp.]|nr:hypothetical protein [Endomicrobium sp.]
MKRKFRKFSAVLTAALFCFSALTTDVGAVVLPQSVNGQFVNFKISAFIPLSIGKITSVNDKQSASVIINIQDLHSHGDTQRNISSLIDIIASKYNLSGIYTEGGVGNVDVGWINQVQDASLREQIIEKLLGDGYLTASEYYSMKSGKTYLFKGLEDEKIHNANIKRLADIENNQNKYENVLNKVKKEIKILNKIYTNDRNVRFNATIDNYNSGKISGAKFYKLIKRYVDDINANPSKYNSVTKLDIDNYPNIKFYLKMTNEALKVDNNRASAELRQIIMLLKDSLSFKQYGSLLEDTNNFQDIEKTTEFISGFLKANPDIKVKHENLDKLIAVNEWARLLNPVELLNEQRQLSEQIKFALSYNDTEAEISFITDFEKYFRNYLTASLTQDDWLYVKKNLDMFIEIYDKYAAVNHIKEIETDFLQLNAYYDINTDRNEIFLLNLIDKNASASSSDKINFYGNAPEMLKNAKDVKIVITGGYHSEGLKNLLSQKEISSIVITPNVTTDISKANLTYKEIVKEQSKFPSEALAYLLTSNTPDANQIAQILKAAISLGLEETAIKDLINKIDNPKVEIISENDSIIVKSKTGNFEKTISLKEDVKRISPSAAAQALNGVSGFSLDIKKLFVNPLGRLNEAEIGVFKAIGGLLPMLDIFVENGAIAEIEEAGLLGQSLAGVDASAYARYPAIMQKILLNIEQKTRESVKDRPKAALTSDAALLNYWKNAWLPRQMRKIFKNLTIDSPIIRRLAAISLG